MDDVAVYYDKNTSRFLRFGGSGEIGAIHRQIWAPGVSTVQEAFLYLNRLVAKELALSPGSNLPKNSLLDLGCGIGGTATWLAEQMNHRVIGISNSSIQVELASQRAKKMGLANRCNFIMADFQDLPELPPVGGVYAIESYIHTRRPDALISRLADILPSGARWVICDDFLADDVKNQSFSGRAQSWLQRFQRGWHVKNLQTVEWTRRLAEQYDFRIIKIQDLSAYTTSFHPFVLGLASLFSWWPLRTAYLENLCGGAALQVCLREGWTRYCALTLERY